MKEIVRPAISVFFLLTLLTGVAYPVAFTGLAQLLFPRQANGSLLRDGDKILGSDLIGQPFSEARYFWSRPSATAPVPYDAASSAGSNLGPTNPAWRDAVRGRIQVLRAADPELKGLIPVDLVTASASGLDSHISPAAALCQVGRVARARRLPEDRLRALVHELVEDRTLGLLGEQRVNVLRLNLALDSLFGRAVDKDRRLKGR
ncbi:MAG TPA: potassium-transporting ATPase subunit KdpC [Candidatus Polarisedimenticolia bacterium]|nr:potassium-transporting ATPase subunit KdpC [Candidatus Polarisedimenticolia bacterium]